MGGQHEELFVGTMPATGRGAEVGGYWEGKEEATGGKGREEATRRGGERGGCYWVGVLGEGEGRCRMLTGDGE